MRRLAWSGSKLAMMLMSRRSQRTVVSASLEHATLSTATGMLVRERVLAVRNFFLPQVVHVYVLGARASKLMITTHPSVCARAREFSFERTEKKILLVVFVERENSLV